MNSVTVDHIYLNREWSICFVVTRMKRATTRGTTPPPSPAPRPRTPTTATALDVMVPCCTHWKTPTRTCMTRSWNRWTRVYARVVFSNEWLVWFSKAEVDLGVLTRAGILECFWDLEPEHVCVCVRGSISKILWWIKGKALTQRLCLKFSRSANNFSLNTKIRDRTSGSLSQELWNMFCTCYYQTYWNLLNDIGTHYWNTIDWVEIFTFPFCI